MTPDAVEGSHFQQMNLAEQIEKLAALLRESRRILIFTGAGISTGSGIPDFRGPHGIWKTRQPVYYDEFMSSEKGRVAHWDYKLEYWPVFRDAQPTATHRAVAGLERSGRVLLVLTQNIDGLHTLAGTSRERLVEIHGTNSLVECQSCGELTDPAPHFERFAGTRRPPLCHCGGYLKLATISFGQNLRPADLERAQAAALDADCVVALGSTLSVYPAADFPLLAAQRGVPYAIINRGPTDHDALPQVTLRIDGDVAEIFPQAVNTMLRADLPP
jgi:NAD-dependent deacetylase